MKKLLLLGLLFSFQLLAQTIVIQRPDCILPLGLLTAAPTNVPATNGFDNRTLGCNTWVIDYNSFGFTALSLVVQTAPNATGNIPGAWSTFTVVTGINPNTATTQAVSTFGGTTSYFPWVRVQLTSVTGTGSITGVLYGWKIPAAPPGGSGCIGTGADPCEVDGPTASGSAPTFPPVLVAGRTGNDAGPGVIQTMHVDTAGNPIVVGPAADGAAPSGSPVRVAGTTTGNLIQSLSLNPAGYLLETPSATNGALADAASNTTWQPTQENGNVIKLNTLPSVFNGATWDRQFACANQASFNLSASGNTQIIAASGSTIIRICHISFSTTAAEDIKLTRGTGADCATGTADVTGLYKSVQSMALDFSPDAALRGAASGAICINQSAAQALGGIVIFAQF